MMFSIVSQIFKDGKEGATDKDIARNPTKIYVNSKKTSIKPQKQKISLNLLNENNENNNIQFDEVSKDEDSETPKPQ